MLILGVDPGKTGAVALYDAEHDRFELAQLLPLDERLGVIDSSTLVGLCSTADRVVVEQVHAMPKQGVTSTFNFGKVYGSIIGICSLYFPDNETKLVRPQLWRQALGMRPGSSKPSVEFIKRHYPSVDLTPGRKRTPDHNIADACCIAIAGARLFKREPVKVLTLPRDYS